MSAVAATVTNGAVMSVLFCKTIFSGTHILISDWRPQYSTSLVSS